MLFIKLFRLIPFYVTLLVHVWIYLQITFFQTLATAFTFFQLQNRLIIYALKSNHCLFQEFTKNYFAWEQPTSLFQSKILVCESFSYRQLTSILSLFFNAFTLYSIKNPNYNYKFYVSSIHSSFKLTTRTITYFSTFTATISAQLPWLTFTCAQLNYCVVFKLASHTF